MGLARTIYTFDFFTNAIQNALSKMSRRDYFISMQKETMPPDTESQGKTGQLLKKGECLRKDWKRGIPQLLSLHWLMINFNVICFICCLICCEGMMVFDELNSEFFGLLLCCWWSGLKSGLRLHWKWIRQERRCNVLFVNFPKLLHYVPLNSSTIFLNRHWAGLSLSQTLNVTLW